MYLKLTLPILIFSLIGCSTNPRIVKKAQLKNTYYESAVRTLLDGTWIVRKTKHTPIRKGVHPSKHYEYYSGLHAHTIGCKSYSQIPLKLPEYEKAYKCVTNGTYLTKNSLAVGAPWQ